MASSDEKCQKCGGETYWDKPRDETDDSSMQFCRACNGHTINCTCGTGKPRGA